MNELINYVTETPENTNPNVVRSLANQIPASGGAGGGVLIVTVTQSSIPGGSKYTADATYNDVHSAITSGKNVVFITDDYYMDLVSRISPYELDPEEPYDDPYYEVRTGEMDYSATSPTEFLAYTEMS